MTRKVVGKRTFPIYDMDSVHYIMDWLIGLDWEKSDPLVAEITVEQILDDEIQRDMGTREGN